MGRILYVRRRRLSGSVDLEVASTQSEHRPASKGLAASLIWKTYCLLIYTALNLTLADDPLVLLIAAPHLILILAIMLWHSLDDDVGASWSVFVTEGY